MSSHTHSIASAPFSKSGSVRLLAMLAVSFGVLYTPAYAVTLFSEDFESSLDKWTGQDQGATSAVIVDDPLNSGRGHVLTFSQLDVAGDIFSTNSLTTPHTLSISFDYLGLPEPGSIEGNLGGYVGLALDYNAASWIAGTWDADTTPGLFQLVDDGQWHRVTIVIEGPIPDYHLTLEDWFYSYGVAGDVYFDNIQVISIHHPKISINASSSHDVTIAWDTVAGDIYTLETHSGDSAHTWAIFDPNIIYGDGFQFVTNIAVSPSQPHNLFRVRVQSDGMP